jgi:hypothetical protein
VSEDSQMKPFVYHCDLLEGVIVELRRQLAEAQRVITQVDEVLIVNNVGPRTDGDYRKALHDLITLNIQIHDDPAVSEVAAKRAAEIERLTKERDAARQACEQHILDWHPVLDQRDSLWELLQESESLLVMVEDSHPSVVTRKRYRELRLRVTAALAGESAPVEEGE